ncbi:MAG TPA: flavodoxin-dependent (E)-4-hydroxy-3-methylbut-2-enyl-diphosphate synthase [Firmicutes bacterium]|nr:flavodoxin-dependent (E)-4-hydroxy-3-methylbut-2-enyl-diphosphate synthase [Bacillota bacterium]
MAEHRTRSVAVGNVIIGADNPVALQSMTNTDTRDVKATLRQIHQLVDAGCDLVRVSVPDAESVIAFGQLVKVAPCPLIADVHFDYRLAVGALKEGASKVRINPGNIGDWERVAAIIAAAKEREAAIRIGVNSGSLPKHILAKYKRPTAEALVEAGLEYLDRFLAADFDRIVFSFKSSDVPTTIRAYRLAASRLEWPLHVGVTEAGTTWRGTIHSCVGIGTLLAENIGDTIRVSLTTDPVEEVKVGLEILRALGLRAPGISVTSCPTCARTPENLIGLAERFEQMVAGMEGQARVAIMGCAVNGPGEAREADLGLALGPGKALLFVGGEIVETVPIEQALQRLYDEVVRFIDKRKE